MTTDINQSKETQVRVWDPFVRIFHWTLVLAFSVSYIVEDHYLNVHVWAGYIVLALITARILWGFVGSAHARFSDFVYRPSTIFTYLKDVLLMHPRRYLGHNPAGGAMIVLMVISLLALTISGVALYGADQHAGPMAGMMQGVSHDGEEILEEVHEFLANFTLALVFIHIAGVIVESVLHRENLVRAMVTGSKRA